MESSGRVEGIIVPSYRAKEDVSWYHFLHDNVPGHRFDFMYRPEVPQGRLSRYHFARLSRLIKRVEPDAEGEIGFAIGNLSFDDPDAAPGRGGAAIIFGVRLHGVKDLSGRADPPFSHAIAAVDRDLGCASLLAAARLIHRRTLVEADVAEWYREYVRRLTEDPGSLPGALASYVASFDDLPALSPATGAPKWVTGGAALSRRIIIAHEDDAPFDLIARCAARIAAVLLRSDARWTSISNRRTADLSSGVSIHILGQREIDRSAGEPAPIAIEDVPEDEAEIAKQLFGARASGEPSMDPPIPSWRELVAPAPPPVYEDLEIDWNSSKRGAISAKVARAIARPPSPRSAATSSASTAIAAPTPEAAPSAEEIAVTTTAAGAMTLATTLPEASPAPAWSPSPSFRRSARADRGRWIAIGAAALSMVALVAALIALRGAAAAAKTDPVIHRDLPAKSAETPPPTPPAPEPPPPVATVTASAETMQAAPPPSSDSPGEPDRAPEARSRSRIAAPWRSPAAAPSGLAAPKPTSLIGGPPRF